MVNARGVGAGDARGAGQVHLRCPEEIHAPVRINGVRQRAVVSVIGRSAGRNDTAVERWYSSA